MDSDPLLRLLADDKVVEFASDVMSKLEYIRYDSKRIGVFRTRWCHDLFRAAAKKIGLPPDWDIDVWFSETLSTQSYTTKFDLKPSQFLQDVETNWLAALLGIEQNHPGFIHVLHNTLKMEDDTHHKLAEKSKKEDEYDFKGLGIRNKAIQQQMLCLPAPPANPQKRLMIMQKKPVVK